MEIWGFVVRVMEGGEGEEDSAGVGVGKWGVMERIWWGLEDCFVGEDLRSMQH